MAHLDPLSLEAQNLDYYPTSGFKISVAECGKVN